MGVQPYLDKGNLSLSCVQSVHSGPILSRTRTLCGVILSLSNKVSFFLAKKKDCKKYSRCLPRLPASSNKKDMYLCSGFRNKLTKQGYVGLIKFGRSYNPEQSNAQQ